MLMCMLQCPFFSLFIFFTTKMGFLISLCVFLFRIFEKKMKILTVLRLTIHSRVIMWRSKKIVKVKQSPQTQSQSHRFLQANKQTKKKFIFFFKLLNFTISLLLLVTPLSSFSTPS